MGNRKWCGQTMVGIWFRRFLLVFSVLFFSLQTLASDTLFEGYYKITSGDQHIGFSILRYQFDAKKKQFTSQMLNRISAGGNVVMESLVAKADATLNPISYKYTSIVGTQTKTIDAQFSKGKMSATITETGKKKISVKNDIKPGTFLSTFLVYTMLRSPTGIQTKSNYTYKAIAEEDATVETGTAKVLKEEKYKGFGAFRIENTFKNSRFVSFVTDKGEALATEVKDAHILSELVPQASEAIGTIGLPEAVVKTVFGSVPSGEKNVVSQYFKSLENQPKAGKQIGVPGGKGIILKGKSPSGKTQEGP